MTLTADALSAYRTAARLLATLTNVRIDLLSEALDETAPGTGVEITGYHDLGERFAVCVPQGARAQVRSLRPQQAAVALDSDFPDWLSLEGWLPTGSTADRCVIEAEMLAERAIAAEVFVRIIEADGTGLDQPPQSWRLDGRGISVAEVPLDPDDSRPRKIVVLLRRPPAEITLRQLALVPV
ncbi:hypothetical protein DRW48_07695 [Paracoccus suum]|uniref:Uncharacterized protein n=1 Tax=Paracoccus suum TaxID=2259340 RepID=A0A344PJN4_9RHOB|nr:hypothetical protein [Paracoccus suum]AXC49589.1 hypothetical protein DRW48_07695 [Paracoccus suum]